MVPQASTGHLDIGSSRLHVGCVCVYMCVGVFTCVWGCPLCVLVCMPMGVEAREQSQFILQTPSTLIFETWSLTDLEHTK